MMDVSEPHSTPSRSVVDPPSPTFESEQNTVVWTRLRLALGIAIICNLTFFLVDALATPDQFDFLIPPRTAVEIGCLILLGLSRTRLGPRYAWIYIVAFYCVLGFGLAHFARVTGGFSSFHYNGVTFVFLAIAFFIPVTWKVHAVGQLLVLIYYFGLNSLFPLGPVDGANRLHNLLILVWTSLICNYAVYLYQTLMRREFDSRRELQITNRKLLELDRLKNEFFANVSHELRTPLTLIIGAFESLIRSSAEVRATAQTGLRNSARLLLLINDLLDLAKSESGRLEPVKQCVDLAALVRQVAANFDSSNSRRRISMEGLDEVVPIEVDPKQIKKVVYNLLSNAFKFTDPDNGRLWIRLHVQGAHVQLVFEDNGIGIPAEYLDRIFDRFYQVEGNARRRYDGTGIGLALVKEIVTHHGGNVSVRSEVDRGTAFTVLLPRGQTDTPSRTDAEDTEFSVHLRHLRASSPDAQIQPPSAKPYPPGTPMVLVADDNPDLCHYVEHILSPHFRIRTARDGTEAFELAKAEGPDLILTDIMMPGMTGHDLLKAIRHDRELCATPVVFLTARAGQEALVESLEVGADDYLAKPFEEAELLARIRTLLRARAQEKEISHLREQLIQAQGLTIEKQVQELSTLNLTVEAITSELVLDKLLSNVLQLVANNLGFTRLMLLLYRSDRGVVSGVYTVGFPIELGRPLHDIELPVTDDGSLRSDLLLHGRSFLVERLDSVAGRVHPDFMNLFQQLGVTSFVCAPLKYQHQVLGLLGADRGNLPCTESDRALIVTVAGYLAVALDNARAYRNLEQLAQSLEDRVQERTQELQAANEKLRELDQLKSAFVSIVSHELRTPISSIRGYVENMLDGLTGNLTEKQTRYLSRIRHNTERLTRMINDLLDLSRIESGRLELHPVALHVEDLVDETVEGLQFNAGEKHISLKLARSEPLPQVRADRDKLGQILTNIIQNAVKFTPVGGHIDVNLTRTDDFVQFSVSDSGCGISPEEVDKVFDKFYRCANTASNTPGAGLGLSITKSLVELHGGRIWLESSVGTGTTFYFTIPLEPMVAPA